MYLSDGRDAETLLKKADAALFHAEAKGEATSIRSLCRVGLRVGDGLSSRLASWMGVRLGRTMRPLDV